MNRRAVLSIVSAFVALAAFGADRTLYLPGVASARGVNDSIFESTLWVANLGTADGAVSFRFVPSSGNAPSPVTRSIRAGETVTIARPLAELFGLESTFGTLVVSGDVPLAARGTTADVSDPAGTFGLDLAISTPASTLLAGETGHVGWISHARDSASGYRTNVGVTLLEPDTSVMLTVFDETGFVRGVKLVESASPRAWQASVASFVTEANLPIGRLEAAVRRGEAIVYTSVVDNRTGDGVFFPAQRAARASGSWRMNGVARAPGREGSSWSTDIRLHNPTLEPLGVDVAWLGSPAATLQRTIPARGSLELIDVLGPQGLGFDQPIAGALRVAASQPFFSAARTVNRSTVSSPTFGAGLATLDDGDWLAAGDEVAFIGLADDAGTGGFRSNLALLAGAASVTGRLRLFDAAGVARGDVGFALAAGEWKQLALRTWFGQPIPSAARIELALDAGQVDAYVSVVDNGTGDPVVIRPRRRPSPTCTDPQIAAFGATGDSGATTLTLTATGTGEHEARIVPGDLPIPLSGSIVVSPRLPSRYRAVISGGCSEVVSASVLVERPLAAAEALTEAGVLVGDHETGAIAFRGIPYAAPPVESLRFRPPVSPEPGPSPRNAGSFGAICPQLDSSGRYQGSEDCLFLNVFRPDPLPAAALPVIVFLHGGANYEGAASLDYYDGRHLAADFGAVVVTLNYRLGALGFFAHRALAATAEWGVSGNYGLLDQIAALAWVRRNIASFGGDPERVLLYGQSAGGYDACALLASPLAKGLFAGVMVQSGGCAGIAIEDVEAFGETISAKVGCDGVADPAACLRAESAETIVQAIPGASPVAADTGQLYVYAVDGFVLPAPPLDALRGGAARTVPLAVGNTAAETAFYTPVVLTPFDYQAQLYAWFGAALGNEVAAKYPVWEFASPFEALVAVGTDSRWICHSRQVLRAAAEGGAEALWRYHFEHTLDNSSYAAYGAFHGIDLPFVFQTYGALPGTIVTSRETDLGKAMAANWVELAATGGLEDWPKYVVARDPFVRLDTPIGSGEGLRRERCDFWDEVWGRGAKRRASFPEVPPGQD